MRILLGLQIIHVLHEKFFCFVGGVVELVVNPVLIEGKLTLRTRQPDCLSPVESIDLLFYLVLETSFYSQQQFKVFRSLQAYNQMVSGFIASAQGHTLADKFVVLAKVRHYSIV